MSFEENIKKNDITLPEPTNPVGSYVATKISNKMLFISGQISIDENGNLIREKLVKTWIQRQDIMQQKDVL